MFHALVGNHLRIFLFLLTIVGDVLAFKKCTNTFYRLAEYVAHFGVWLLFIACWIPFVPHSLNWGLVFFLAFAVFWEVLTFLPDARESLAKEDSTTMSKLLEFALPVVLVGPAYIGAAIGVYQKCF